MVSRDTHLELSREWVNELKGTARDFDAALKLAAEALETFADEDYGRATVLAERAKSVASRSGLVRELLGLCYYHLGRWQEASRELLTFRRLTNSPDENHVVADCYRALKRPERALEICNEVHRRAVSPETWAEVCIVAAGAHADREEIDQALNSLSRADLSPRSVEPRHLKLWYVQADLLERAGRSEQARDFWERISAEDPDYFDVPAKLKEFTDP